MPAAHAQTEGKGGGKGGGKSRTGSKKISGVEFSWDPDLGMHTPAPSPLFPPYKPAPPKPLTNDEKTQVARFLSLRTSIHEGPFYTVLGDNVRIGKTSASAAATFDPFEGMPTYSQKYTKRRRKIPKLDSRPYVLKFFPEELWSTLDPTSAIRSGDGTQVPGKRLQLSAVKKLDDLDRENLSGEEDEGGEQQQQQQNADDDEAELDEAEVDDEYDEDDDEGGDYNAEQYFDDGGDDAADDYDGGEGDGGAGGGDYY